MRIAFLFVGQLRTFEHNVGNIKQQLEYFKATPGVTCVDVFCHTWTRDGIQAGWKPMQEKEHGSEEAITDLLQQTLSPKKIQVNEYIEKDYMPNEEIWARYQDKNDHWYGWRGTRTIGMNYTLYACNELKKQYEEEQGWKYDLVIKTRYDVQYRRPAISREDLKRLDLTKFWMPTNSSSNNVNDIIFFGNSEIMDRVCCMYPLFDKYYKEGVIIFCENILSHHLTANNIPIGRIDIPYAMMYSKDNCSKVQDESFL
jgi:hypothetical protein